MKRTLIFAVLIVLVSATASVLADPMDELIQSLDSEYEALTPAPNSSVGTDYPLRQAALGSLYATKSMGLIYQQNQEMLSRQGELAEKYDQIIDQNQEIIRLLSIIAERLEPVEEAPGVPNSGYSGQ